MINDRQSQTSLHKITLDLLICHSNQSILFLFDLKGKFSLDLHENWLHNFLLLFEKLTKKRKHY